MKEGLINRYKSCIHILCFGVFVFLFLLSDTLLWLSDVGQLTVNGWIGLLVGFFPLCFVGIAPLLLFGRRAKLFYFCFFSIEFLIQICGWFARINFKMLLDGDLVGIILCSSVDEMLWFLQHYMSLTSIVFLLLLISLWFVGLKVISWSCRLRVTSTTVALGVGAVLVFFYANHVFQAFVFWNFGNLERQIFGVHLVVDSFRNLDYFNRLAVMKKTPQLPCNIKVSEDYPENVVGAVVLGESATRNHWGLYGYGRMTTPCLESRRDELVVFEDLVTPVASTAVAMRYAFTTATIKQPDDLRFTMAQCLKRVGYEVVMFSNQQRWGEWDSEETFDFAGCDFKFMSEQGEMVGFDEVLLPYFTNHLESVSKKSIVFLHLQGSHVPARIRYPLKGAPFAPESLAHAVDENNPALTKNHYDNSIWYTDKVLGQMIAELESLHKPCWLIYFSDHGETPSSTNWRSQDDNDLWEVPFVVWLSKEFCQRCPSKVKMLRGAAKLPLQTDQLLYGLLDFCGVEGLGNDSWEDFISPDFRCRQARKVQGGNTEYKRRGK